MSHFIPRIPAAAAGLLFVLLTAQCSATRENETPGASRARLNETQAATSVSAPAAPATPATDAAVVPADAANPPGTATATPAPAATASAATVKRSNTEYKADIKAADATIKAKPRDYDAYMTRGRAHAALKNYRDAMTDFNMALRLKPSSADALYNRGLTRGKNQGVQRRHQRLQPRAAHPPRR